MGELTTEYKIKLGKIMSIIGTVTTVFIPFFGIVFLSLGFYITRKPVNLEMKHIFYINLISFIAAIILIITSLIFTFL